MWDSEGKWTGFHFKDGVLDDNAALTDMKQLDAEEFATNYQDLSPPMVGEDHSVELYRQDGAVFHPIGLSNIPAGWVQAPVCLNDNGKKFDCTMVAGSVGMLVGESQDCMQPVSGWFFFTMKAERVSPYAMFEKQA
jgi:hypothetical protein